jgi:hypothetical protein|nr:MAG TPA: Protein of unknown function (DUF551) [Caudoviricetes sp.]
MGKKQYNRWVSVKEKLPDYGEVVLVCNEKDPCDVWFTSRSKLNARTDNDGFGYSLEADVTHWIRVKPLNKRQYDTNKI